MRDIKKEFYLEWGREKQSLMTTKELISLFIEASLRDIPNWFLNDLKNLIKETAKSEWGHGTEVEFCKPLSVKMINKSKQKEKVFKNEEFSSSIHNQ